MIKDEFNNNRDPLLRRLAPKPPENLVDKIIAASQMPYSERPNRSERAAKSNVKQGVAGGIAAFIFIPRPVMVMSLIFVLSLFAGIKFDIGLDAPEEALISAKDILFSFSEDDL